MAAAAILNFRVMRSFHYYPTKPRQIYSERCKSVVEQISRVKSIAQSQKTRWRLPPSCFTLTVAFALFFDKFSSNLVEVKPILCQAQVDSL